MSKVNVRSMHMLKGIIFDFDGTILDTEEPWYIAFSKLYQQYGHELPLSLYSKIIGANKSSDNYIDPVQHLIDLVGVELSYESLREAVHLHHQELMLTKSMRPGVIELLKVAKSNCLQIGLASSSSKDWVNHHLNRLGILDYFNAIRTSDDVDVAKPHPDLYLKTVEALGLQHDEVFAIEDSPNGCASAKAAGIKCVVVPHAITEAMTFPDHEVRLNSLNDLSFKQLVEAIHL